MFKLSAKKILLAASALVMCAGFAQAQTPPVSPLKAAPTSVSLTFTLPATAGAQVPVAFSVTAGSDPFVIDPTTVPSWLSTDITGGTATTGAGQTVNFVASSAAGILNPGGYSASVHVRVNGFQDLVVPVSLTVVGAPSTLTVMNGVTSVTSGGAVQSTAWVYGAAAPTLALSLISSDDPIGFTAVSAPTVASPENWIQLSEASGIAYNYGTTLTITYAQDALINSKVGQTLTGTVTITYNGGSTFVVNVNVVVGEPLPTVTSVFPREIPTQASKSATVVITGTGFGTVPQGFTTATVVKIAYGAVAATDLTTIQSNDVAPVQGAVNVVNPTTMILTIPWNDTNGVSILDTAPQTVNITITNGLGGETPLALTVGGAPLALYVTAKPIVYSVTDAAGLTEPPAGKLANVAPYEMISIFGNNFCPTCASPVVATTSSSRYPTTLSAGGSNLTVTFYKADGTTLVGDAYILFATDNQINVLVPSTVAVADNPMQVVVSYAGVLSNTNVIYEVNAAAANPGIFTMSSNGTGQGAILLSPSYTLNSAASASTKAAAGSTVLIYVTGLGAPNSTAADSNAAKAATFPASCISPANYVTKAALNPATADGAVLLPADIATNVLPPCFITKGQVAVTIGGLAATVTYAGWVADSVAGLYQINATVPTKAAHGTNSVSVTVTNGAAVATSQAGVTMQVQ
jgi:uncharacterized protein (TIGR03437 family)